jgi:hypothetical protein
MAHLLSGIRSGCLYGIIPEISMAVKVAIKASNLIIRHNARPAMAYRKTARGM